MEAVSVQRQVAGGAAAELAPQVNLLEGGDHHHHHHHLHKHLYRYCNNVVDDDDDQAADQENDHREEETRQEFSSQVAAVGQTSQLQSEGDCTTSTFSRPKDEPDKLHEWLAREIESRFNHQSANSSRSATLNTSNRVSGSATGATTSTTTTTNNTAKKKTSLLDALIEGRKSWLEQKTVIVEINNGRRVVSRSQEEEEEEEEELKQRSVAINKTQQVRDQSPIGNRNSDFLNLKQPTQQQNSKADTQNYETLAANKQSRTLSAKKKEATATESKEQSSKQDNQNQEKSTTAAAFTPAGGEAVGTGTGTGLGASGSVGGEGGNEGKVNSKEDSHISKGETASRKGPDSRQQVPPSVDSSQDRRLPTFGKAPTKISRLPYYSYSGKARNVELVTAADRKERLEEQRSDSTSTGSSQRSLSSPAVGSKIPTLAQVSAFGSGADGAGGGGLESEIDQEDRRELELTRRSQRQYRTAGYSNISNLFPAKSMNQRQEIQNQRTDYHHSSPATAAAATPNSRRNIRFSSAERDRARQQAKSSSLLNLTTPHNSSSSNSNRPRSSDRYRVGSALSGSGGFNRRNSISSYTTHNNHRSNRSMNSLNASPYSNTSDNIAPATGSSTQQLHSATGAMRRQNSNAGYVQHNSSNINKQRPPSAGYQGRSSSASGYIGRNHHRSPSASSLHYGSAGMSPYGPPPVDPDCPVHGYSPVNGLHSKSSQHLVSAGANMDSADLLYEPYNSFYADRPGQMMQSGGGGGGGGGNSLYSPTSPQSPLINQRPASTYGLNSSRQLNSAPAYYNGSSRFSMYHSPGSGGVGGGGGGGGVKTSLAPTNEQLRRILGYQPHTKPIYLHPQWAYSRPFIHLQGTRSPSPGSPMLDPDDDDREIRPRFEPYNQLHDTQAIRAVDFHPSGEVYAVGSNSRALRICAYPADYELRHFGQDHVTTAPRVLFKFLQVHRGSIYCVRFNSTGQLLATGSNDQTVHIVRYNSVTHSPDGDEYRLTMHDGTVRDLCFIDDSTNGSSVLLSAGGGDNKIYVTDCDTITPFQSMAGHTQMIMALNHWGGANFVSASYDRTIRFWDLRTRACTSIISAPPGYGTAGKRVGPGAPACAVEVDSSGRLLASGHSDSTCMLYDIRGARIIQAFKPHDDEIRTVSFSPKSYYLLTGGYDGRIVLSDLQGDLTQPLPSVCVAESDDKIVQSKWHPSDFTFMTTSADKTATLWALPTE